MKTPKQVSFVVEVLPDGSREFFLGGFGTPEIPYRFFSGGLELFEVIRNDEIFPISGEELARKMVEPPSASNPFADPKSYHAGDEIRLTAKSEGEATLYNIMAAA